MFPVYHLVAANIRSIWKHEVYSLLFIAPLAGFAIAELFGYLRGHIAPRAIGMRVISAGLTIAAIFLFVSYGLQQNAAFHNSWPNNQNVIDFMKGQHLTAKSKVLSSSYAIYDYYFRFSPAERHSVWSNVWYTEYKNLKGTAAVQQAIQDCFYDIIVIDNFYMPEAPQTLDPLILKSGYVVKYMDAKVLSSNGTLTTRIYERAANGQCKESAS